MNMQSRRVQEILGLKGAGRDANGLAAAVEKGLPRSALLRVVARAGLSGRTPLESAGSELGARAVEGVVMRALYGLPI
jgi:hypothetical protein